MRSANIRPILKGALPLATGRTKSRTGVQFLVAASLFAAPHNIAAQSATPAADISVKASREVAETLAQLMQDQFVYPDIGLKYASMLREKAAAGAYDSLAGAGLANTVTADLLAIYPDGHVRVKAVSSGAAQTSGQSRREPVTASEPPRWAAPGIALIRINEFSGDKTNVEAMAKFVTDFAGAKVVIFDLRSNGGGGLEEMDVLFPQLFAKATPLVRMATRRSVFEKSGMPFADTQSLRKVEGDPAFITHEHWALSAKSARLKGAKVYVLTSQRTASAAEHFALAIKSSGRGTLVGTRTAGANHFGDIAELGHGFSAFIPVGRTFDPATGKDWEGTGVLPDIETPPDDALNAVLKREGVA